MIINKDGIEIDNIRNLHIDICARIEENIHPNHINMLTIMLKNLKKQLPESGKAEIKGSFVCITAIIPVRDIKELLSVDFQLADALSRIIRRLGSSSATDFKWEFGYSEAHEIIQPHNHKEYKISNYISDLDWKASSAVVPYY